MKPTRSATYIVALCLASTTLAAQANDTTSGQKTFFTRRDAVLTGVAIAGSAVVSVFDERIGRWARSPGVQGDSARHAMIENLTVINEVPLTLGAVAVYGMGRIIGSDVTAKVGLHATEAFVLTVAASELIRAPLGRSRPRISPDDAYRFTFGG